MAENENSSVGMVFFVTATLGNRASCREQFTFCQRIKVLQASEQ